MNGCGRLTRHHKPVNSEAASTTSLIGAVTSPSSVALVAVRRAAVNPARGDAEIPAEGVSDDDEQRPRRRHDQEHRAVAGCAIDRRHQQRQSDGVCGRNRAVGAGRYPSGVNVQSASGHGVCSAHDCDTSGRPSIQRRA